MIDALRPHGRRPSRLLHNLVLFGRTLRRAGVEVTSGHLRTLAHALDDVGLEKRADVKDAARAILVQRREQIELFDRLFDLFFRDWPEPGRGGLDLGRRWRRRWRDKRKLLPDEAPPGSGGEAGDAEPRVEARFTYSASELLRRKDFAELAPDEVRAVRKLLRERPLEPPPRRTRRTVAGRRGGTLDLRRTLRHSLRHGGETLRLARRRRKEKLRPVVVICDVSGSMELYSRIFLQFIYALRSSTERLEAFVFGTRLTRITRELRHRDPDRALREATAAIPDWGGGTRIGESLRRFNYDWGRRVLGRGPVVVVVSDGWDRGEIELLDREVSRLRRCCQRLIWLNPLLGSPGYEPLTRGIRTVLPYVDDFLPVHNLESLEQLAEILAER